MPVFAKDPRVNFTRRCFCCMDEIPKRWLHYRSRFQNRCPVELLDMISAGEIPSLVELFPLALVPAALLGANEAATIPRPRSSAAFRSQRTTPHPVRSSQSQDVSLLRCVLTHAGLENYRSIQCVHTARIDGGEATSPSLLDIPHSHPHLALKQG